MVSTWLIWLIAVIGEVRAVIAIIAAFLFVYAYFTDKGAKKLLYAASMVVALLSAMIPSQKGLAAMVLVPAVLNDQRMQNITGNSLEILERLTHKWMLEVIKDDSKWQEMNCQNEKGKQNEPCG